MLRLNVREQVGRDMMRRMDVGLVPALGVFDGSGKLVYVQSGRWPDGAAILAAIRRL